MHPERFATQEGAPPHTTARDGGPSAKRVLKRAAQQVLARVGPHRMPGRRGRLLVLMYHRVLPADHPELPIVQPGMFVTPDTFRMHLGLLKTHFNVVTLGAWVRAARAGEPVPDRACAITFDDGWADNFEYALPVLREEKVPATVFLVHDMVGAGASFWPERLARVLWNDGRGLPGRLRDAPAFAWLTVPNGPPVTWDGPPDRADLDAAIVWSKRFSDPELAERLAVMEAMLTPPAGDRSPVRDLLAWDEVDAMVASGLVEVGSHSRTHRRLTEEVDAATLEDEVVGSQAALVKHLGVPVDLFCYPNGDLSPRAEALVRRFYLGACTTDPEWHSARDDPYRIGRISMHEDACRDPVSFLAGLSGWL